MHATQDKELSNVGMRAGHSPVVRTQQQEGFQTEDGAGTGPWWDRTVVGQDSAATGRCCNRTVLKQDGAGTGGSRRRTCTNNTTWLLGPSLVYVCT